MHNYDCKGYLIDINIMQQRIADSVDKYMHVLPYNSRV